MPIVKSGYAICRRNGSTRAHRKARGQTLAEEMTCHVCGEGDRGPDDPWVADHVVPFGIGGLSVRANYRKAHRSCNGRKGML